MAGGSKDKTEKRKQKEVEQDTGDAVAGSSTSSSSSAVCDAVNTRTKSDKTTMLKPSTARKSEAQSVSPKPSVAVKSATSVTGLSDLTDCLAKVMGEGLARISKTMETSFHVMNGNLEAVVNWQNAGGELYYEPEEGSVSEPDTGVTENLVEHEIHGGKENIPSEAEVCVPPPSKLRKTETGKAKFLSSLVTSKEDEVLGEPLANEALAVKITAIMRERPAQDYEREGLQKILRPENCGGLAPVRVNENIWLELAKNAQAADANMQKVQLPVVKAATAIARISDVMLAHFDDATNSVAFDENTTEEVLSLLNQSLGCLGAANYEVVQRRREKLKGDINSEFGNICSPSHPYTQWLFGEDINQQVEDIATVNKISRRLVKPSASGRGRGKRPWNDNSNSNRGGSQGYYYPPQRYGHQGYWNRGGFRGRAFPQAGGFPRGRGRGRAGPFLGHFGGPPVLGTQGQSHTQTQGKKQ